MSRVCGRVLGAGGGTPWRVTQGLCSDVGAAMLQTSVAWALVIPPMGVLVLGVLALFLERKLIGIAQKRLGISFLGRNGWAHLPADLVKF